MFLTSQLPQSMTATLKETPANGNRVLITLLTGLALKVPMGPSQLDLSVTTLLEQVGYKMFNYGSIVRLRVLHKCMFDL